jgi:hypothetical protein
MPSLATLYFRSTRNQQGNCLPILVTLRWYRILQLLVFVCCPFTRACRRPVDARFQVLMPSVATRCFCSTWDQLGNCLPILVTLRYYRILQLLVFVCCPFSRTCRPVDAMLGSKESSHLSQHWIFVRPGTSAAIVSQFLPPCTRTASFNILSMSAVYLPTRAVVWSTLETNA